MKILIFSYCFPPLKYPRSIQIANLLDALQELAELTIVCGKENESGDKSILSADHPLMMAAHRISRGAFDRLYSKVLSMMGATFVVQPDALKNWAQKAARFAIKQLKDCPNDVVMSFGRPMSSHLGALRIKNELGLPWVAHFSDPWAHNPLEKFRDSKVQKINDELEKLVVKNADLIIFTSKETVDLVMRSYPADWQRKARVLSHCYAHSEISEPSASATPLVFRYLGNFYKERNSANFLKALKYLPENVIGNLRFEFYGSIDDAQLINEAAENPDRFCVLPPVSYAESLSLMKSAHGLLVIDAPADTSVFFPSKLVDYLGSGRPILGITPPGASRRIIESVAGWVANPLEPEEIAKELMKVVEFVRSGQKRFGNEEVRRTYSNTFIAKQLHSMIQGLINGQRLTP